MKFTDLLYFGYDFSDESISNEKAQNDFMNDLKETFLHVEFKDAYDSVKGFRQEIFLNEEDKDAYFAWVIAHGWFEYSFTLTLDSMEKEKYEKLESYINLAKTLYPNNFKSA